ncbi:MAG TPA: HDIG domain-containing protein [Dehalococcoidia bacterium]|nr:HDIG domain-containing protein [Dehalococcoidia bacterium]
MSQNSRSFVLFLSIAGFALAVFIALFPVVSNGLDVQEGAIASRTIRAPRDISFVSDTLTKRRQDEAAAAVKPSLALDPAIATTQQTKLEQQLNALSAILQNSSSPVARAADIQRVPNLSLSPGSVTILRDLNPNDFTAIGAEATKALTSIFEQPLPSGTVASVRETATNYVSTSLNRDMATLIAELIRPFIVTNQVVDQTKTQAARDAARDGVASVNVSYAENQVIVEEGSPITPEAHEALLEAGLIDGSSFRWAQIGADALLAIIAAVAVAAGVRAFRPQISPREMLIMALAVAMPVLVLKLYLPFILPDEHRHFLAYLLPVAAAGMVLAGLVGAEMALLGASLVALLAMFGTVLLLDTSIVGIAGTLDITRIALASGVAGAAGVFAVRNAERIVQFLFGGLLVGVSVMVVLLATWLIDPARELRDLPWMLVAAGVNGGLSAFLSAGIYVTMGSLFGVTTRLQLLEMSQLSQPLLMRLQDEAPSTFQHSVIVANLAEKGAFTIGADALLARVGCYYHDIGKLMRPGFFIENQLGGTNPHDALDPADSARIISEHVTDGKNLARQYKLPARVAQFIPEHHGTRMVAYFYRRAAEQDPDIDIDSFRYPGPKPQSRETAIAMLADSCEAAVRSSPDHSPERINVIVDDIFSERLTEGQLDESNLTLNNIRALAASFKTTLKAIYHPRVEYPAPSDAEMLLRRLPIPRISEHTPENN